MERRVTRTAAETFGTESLTESLFRRLRSYTRGVFQLRWIPIRLSVFSMDELHHLGEEKELALN